MSDTNSENSFLADFLNEGIYIVSDNETKIEVKEEVAEYEVKEEELTKEVSINFYGGNKKSVVILVNYEKEEWIRSKDKMVLEKVLAAVNLNFEDIAIINTRNVEAINIDDLYSSIQAEKYICFGLPKSFLGNYKENELAELNNSKILITSFSITEMAMSKEKKMLLWKNLKLMFGL